MNRSSVILFSADTLYEAKVLYLYTKLKMR